MKTTKWTRRGFLGVVVALPGAVVACGSSESGVAGGSGATTGGGAAGGAGGAGVGGAGGAAGVGGAAAGVGGAGIGGAGIGGAGTGDTTSAGGAGVGGAGAGGSGAGGSGAGGAGAGGAGGGGGPSDTHVCSPNYPRIDLKADCGAVGDGQTNDNAALQKAAKIIQQAGGGELVIPPGVYIVGKQTKKQDPNASGPYYVADPMFSVQSLACLKISGYGAKLKVKDGLHYGGFNPSTGQPQDYTSGGQNRAEVGRVIEIAKCDNVLIEGVEIDGNNQNLIIGGQWGNADIQASATGIWVNMSQNVTIVDVHTHHHGLDGITVLYLNGAPPKKMPHYLKNVVSEYNGRQGISWIGGWGLYCTNCKFNHTGRAVNNNSNKPHRSKPGDGLDIEPNAGTTQKSIDSVFTNCEFVNNWGNGVEAANGTSSNHTFVNCTLWGTTIYSMWINKPNVTFQNCQIHGTFVRGNGTMKFQGCTFEDKEWTNGQVYRSGALVALSNGYDGMTFSDCTFINHKVRAVIIGDANSVEVFDNCTFVHSNASLSNGASQSQFTGAKIRSCHFKESAQVSSGANKYSIALTSVVVVAPAPGDPATHVDGPKVHWNTTGGPTGDIAPGNYG